MQNEILTNVMAFASVLAVIVLSLVQLVKTTVNVPKNWVPFIGVIVGVLVGAVSAPFTDLDIVLRLWAGGLAGLSATGLFELGNKREGGTKE